MRLTNQYIAYESESGDCRFHFLPTGDIATFSCGDTRINCFEGTPAEGSAANIWLRQYSHGEIASVHKLWGADSKGQLAKDKNGNLVFCGTAGKVGYHLSFLPILKRNAWVWRLSLESAPGTVCDVIYGQDIGVADRGNLLSNELYTAQYLAHHVFNTGSGYVIGSRQNRPQSAGNRPCVQQGMLRGKAIGFSTDAMQFLGLDYKAGEHARGLWHGLDNKNFQAELGYIALQTEQFSLDISTVLAFYGMFQQDYPEVMDAPLDTSSLLDALCQMENQGMGSAEVLLQTPCRAKQFGTLFTSKAMSMSQVKQRWPHRELEEWGPEGELWAFHTPSHTHVVTQAKEVQCLRPHAHIIMSAPDEKEIREDYLASTNTIYGVFNAQTAIGNTSMNSLISVHRGLLNQLKNHGQRLWVEIDGQYRLLGLPAVYEMGLNWARWHYLLPDDDCVDVLVFAAAHNPAVVLEVRCNKPRDMMLATQLVMGNEEFDNAIEVHWHENILRIQRGEDMCKTSPYPGLHYDLYFQTKPDEASDDGVFFDDGVGYNHTLLTCMYRKSTGFTLTTVGALEEAPCVPEPRFDFDAEYNAWIKVHAGFTAGLHITAAKEPLKHKAQQLDYTAWWFAHNALVHFASPHGLEQTSGAAWGTRDVCQGPFEFFMATGHFVLARNLLVRVFTHQLEHTGEWPQWFMFDKYTQHAPECHGDVVFWPLRCLATYIRTTGDESILTARTPWQASSVEESILVHLHKAIEAITKRIVPGTWLVDYAGGDWNDTLQPADSELRKELVSSWTQALAAETMGTLAHVLVEHDPELSTKLGRYAVGMTNDFESKLIADGVVMGLARIRDDKTIIPMLHPIDGETGIHYRLLPLIQSIISGIVTQEQAERNFEIIQQHLLYPDGARLMDRPIRYTGGNSVLFQRAEQDANVGRETGLMYTHAHIRYIEALVSAGRMNEAWEALFCVSPVAVREVSPNAMPRQSNVCFSSSDALFLDRYAFQECYDKVKGESVPLLCGWRLYSSAPGLWISVLLRGVLGIQLTPEFVAVSSNHPTNAKGIEISFRYRSEIRALSQMAEKQNGALHG